MTALRFLHMILGAGLYLSSALVSAAGFALSEQSGSGLGTATAGGAAAGEDASTIYSNPAGMTRLTGTQVVLSGAVISSRIRFENTGSTNPAGILAPTPLGASGGDAGTNAFVPNIYLSHALSPAWRLGVGVNAPFGLRTDYESGWVGRFQAVRSELSSVNVNPSIAYRLSDTVSVGAGVSYQLVSAELERARVLGFNTEGTQSLKGAEGSGWGWNIGATWAVGDRTRFGASYRSVVEQTLRGDVSVLAPGGGVVTSFPVQSVLSTPALAVAGFSHDAGAKWTLLADVAWTQWSVVDELRVIDRRDGSVAETQRLGFRDSWRVSAGVRHHVNERFSLRGGVAWDQSPVTDTERTPIVPDSDRTWVAFGARYVATKILTFDVSYAHIFFRSAPINQSGGNPVAQGTLVGTYSNAADVLAAQLTLSFD